MDTAVRTLVCAVVVVGLAAAARAQEDHEDQENEGPGMPYVAPDEPVQTSVPFMDRSFFNGVQVNVNAQGLNALNDAANEPSMAVNPTNPLNIVIGWRQFDNIVSNFRQAGFAYTLDGGVTWHNAGPYSPGVFRSDPVLACDPDGRFVYDSLQVTPSYCTDALISLDGGATWSEPHPMIGGDKAWMCVDPTAGPGRGQLYSSWTSGFTCDTGSSSFVRSVDHGETWAGAGWVSPSTWGTMDVDADGVLYAVDGNGYVSRSVSARDRLQPVVFGTPVQALPGTNGVAYGCVQNPGGLCGQAWIACDRSGGPTRNNVYVVCPSSMTGQSDLDVWFARSVDGGLTWSAPARLNDEPAGARVNQWFANLSVAPNGRIDVTYNDARFGLSAVFYVHSYDGGVTWSVPRQLTSTFNSRQGWPTQDKMGDYNQLISQEDCALLAYAATFNLGANGQGQQDVWFLRIPASPCDSVDFNLDGLIPDFADVTDFVQVFMGGVCEGQAPGSVPCNTDIDFNNDGIFPDTTDISALISVFSGGPCIEG
ncbi:MAG: sialidase family protein [Phycisphaerales bacterium]